jgi:hypothetical protein
VLENASKHFNYVLRYGKEEESYTIIKVLQEEDEEISAMSFRFYCPQVFLHSDFSMIRCEWSGERKRRKIKFKRIFALSDRDSP